jgi:ATP-dependent helicase HrpA
VPEGERVARIVQDTLRALKEAHGFLETRSLSGYPEGVQAVRNQLDRLLRQGWIHSTPDPWFERMPVYVRGVARRLQRMVDDRSRDRGLESMVAPYQHALESLQMEGGRERPARELSRLRWMIEEFRISLFAQNLRTLIPVSAKRLDAQLARARKEHADS